MWEVRKVYDSIGSMFTSWRVGKLMPDGKMMWAGDKTKNYELAEKEAKMLNDKEETK